MDKLIIQEGKCRVVEASEDHVESIYPFMRRADQLEVACLGHTPQSALLEGLKSDDVTLTALDPDGVPMAMFGVGQFGGQAYIWCLGTESINDNAYDFIRASRKWTQILTKPYGATFNYVHKDNELAIKWLKFCGASFLRKVSFSDEPFFEFVIPSK